MKRILGLLLTTSLCLCQYVSPDSEVASSASATLQNIQSKAKTNACMRSALELLKLNCKAMTDEEQSRLAITLSNCHFEKSGKHLFPCESTMSILDCTRNMTGDSWNTYTEFYTHASKSRGSGREHLLLLDVGALAGNHRRHYQQPHKSVSCPRQRPVTPLITP